jgi:hypothetical protein
MSFGFIPISWEEDDKGKTRTLKEVQLHEVSFGVLHPAYDKTTSKTYMRNIEKSNIDIDKLDESLGKDTLDDNDQIIIQDTIDKLSNVIGTALGKKEEPDASLDAGLIKDDSANVLLELECELAA